MRKGDSAPPTGTAERYRFRAAMRYETSVTTNLRFAMGGALDAPAEPEVVTISFRGRDFEWHSNHDVPESRESRDFPTLTTMQREGDSYEIVDSHVQRFLSALSFVYGIAMTAPHAGGTGFAGRRDGAVMRAVGPAMGLHYAQPPRRVEIVDDPVLRGALAFIREARGAASPFYRFFAFWNALDVTFGGDAVALDEYLRTIPTSAGGLLQPFDHIPDDLAEYLRDSSRNAIAHAIRRDPSLASVDPDAPLDRRRLELDARLIEGIVEHRIHELWEHRVYPLSD